MKNTITSVFKNLYYKTARGINLSLFRSGEEGIWYRKKANSKRTLIFLEVILLNHQEDVLTKLLSLIESKFPTAEILGRNLAEIYPSIVEIRMSGFSKYMQERKKKELENLLREDTELWNSASVVFGERFSS